MSTVCWFASIRDQPDNIDIVKCPNMEKTDEYSGTVDFSTQKVNCSKWLKEEINISKSPS